MMNKLTKRGYSIEKTEKVRKKERKKEATD